MSVRKMHILECLYNVHDGDKTKACKSTYEIIGSYAYRPLWTPTTIDFSKAKPGLYGVVITACGAIYTAGCQDHRNQEMWYILVDAAGKVSCTLATDSINIIFPEGDAKKAVSVYAEDNKICMYPNYCNIKVDVVLMPTISELTERRFRPSEYKKEV